MTGREMFNRAWDFTVLPIGGLFLAGGIGAMIGIGLAILLMIYRKP